MTATVSELHGSGRTDVRMMVVVHTTFRRELILGVPAVRRTAIGDVRRAIEVADHVGLVLGLLQHHHEVEDELLWEPMAQRVPAEVAHLVALMSTQHEGVHEHLEATEALLSTWRKSATAVDRDALADALQALVTALCEHLDTEEAHVLPLMSRHLTGAEWDEFAERGMSSLPRGMMLTGFGMMLYEGDPDAVAVEIRKLPAPLRPLLPVLGRHAYRRYSRRVHGTPTPKRVLG